MEQGNSHGEAIIASDFAEAAETLAMLGSPVRIQLMWVLSDGERDVTSLAEAIGQPLTTTSHHLRKMRASGLISSRAEGRRQIYSVDDPHLIELARQSVAHHADLRMHPPGAGR